MWFSRIFSCKNGISNCNIFSIVFGNAVVYNVIEVIVDYAVNSFSFGSESLLINWLQNAVRWPTTSFHCILIGNTKHILTCHIVQTFNNCGVENLSFYDMYANITSEDFIIPVYKLFTQQKSDDMDAFMP